MNEIEKLIDSGIAIDEHTLGLIVENTKEIVVFKKALRNRKTNESLDFPLVVALLMGKEKEEFIKLMIDEGADLTNELGSAIYSRNLEMVQFFIDQGANVNSPALDKAIEINEHFRKEPVEIDWELVELLLRNGAVVETKHLDEALLVQKNYRLFRLLALYSSDINPVILIAASRGMLNGELLEFLFEYDIDLNYKNANNETALTLAIKYKKYSTIITLNRDSEIN